MGFMDLEREYDMVNMKAQWQAPRMYYASGKYLNGIKSMLIV